LTIIWDCPAKPTEITDFLAVPESTLMAKDFAGLALAQAKRRRLMSVAEFTLLFLIF
jgi:hypothetical protein